MALKPQKITTNCKGYRNALITLSKVKTNHLNLSLINSPYYAFYLTSNNYSLLKNVNILICLQKTVRTAASYSVSKYSQINFQNLKVLKLI
jgi:hypothetical protein